jgi:hypothetical protein
MTTVDVDLLRRSVERSASTMGGKSRKKEMTSAQSFVLGGSRRNTVFRTSRSGNQRERKYDASACPSEHFVEDVRLYEENEDLRVVDRFTERSIEMTKEEEQCGKCGGPGVGYSPLYRSFIHLWTGSECWDEEYWKVIFSNFPEMAERYFERYSAIKQSKKALSS